MSDLLAKARADLSSLHEEIALHERAIAEHRAVLVRAQRDAEEICTFICLLEKYGPTGAALAEAAE